jgi:hypothetical protein
MSLPTNLSLTITQVSAVLHGVTLPMGLTLSRVTVEGSGLSWQKEPFKIELDAPGSFKAHVTQDALADFLNKQRPAGLKNFKVQAQGGRLHLDALRSMLIDVPAKAVCTLRIVDKRQLFVDLESVEIMGAAAKHLVQAQLDKINPVLDVAEFPVSAELLELAVDNGEVIMKGTLAPR